MFTSELVLPDEEWLFDVSLSLLTASHQKSKSSSLLLQGGKQNMYTCVLNQWQQKSYRQPRQRCHLQFPPSLLRTGDQSSAPLGIPRSKRPSLYNLHQNPHCQMTFDMGFSCCHQAERKAYKCLLQYSCEQLLKLLELIKRKKKHNAQIQKSHLQGVYLKPI